MPGVSLEDPFLLAEFTTTTSQDQTLSVQCAIAGELKNTADIFAETSDSTENQDANLLVVAVQGEGVQLFNTADQKCIYSYSTPPGFTFQSPAKTISKSKSVRHVYAVIGKGTDITAKEEGKVVWMWRDELTKGTVGQESADMDVDGDVSISPKASTAKKTVKKFDRKIHELFVSSDLSNHIILVNTDASISLVTDDLKRVVFTKEASEPLAKEGIIAWTSGFNSTRSWIPSSILVRNTAVIATATADATKMTVAFSFVNEDHRGITALGQVTLEEQDAHRATAIAFDTTVGQFSYLSAKGQLKIFKFDMIIKDRKITVTESLSFPLPGFVAKTSTPTPAKSSKKASKATAAVSADTFNQRTTSLALGNHYIAIAGVHENQGQSEQILTIWDARYGTLQAKHIIPGSHNVQQTSCQLSVAPDSAIAVTFSTPHGKTVRSHVHLCSFYSEPVSLLNAMGRMKATAPFFGLSSSVDATGTLVVSQESFSSTTTSLLTPSNVTGTIRSKDLALTDFEKRVEQTQQAENKVLESLLSVQQTGGKGTANADTFSKLFFQHVEKQTAIALKDMMEKYRVDADQAQAAVAKDKEQRKDKHSKTSATAMEIDTPQQVAIKDATGDANGMDKKTKKQLKRQKKKAAAAAAAASTPNVAEHKEDGAEGSESESSSEDEDDEEEAEEDAERANQSSEDEFEDAMEEEDEAAEQTRMRAYLEAVSEWRKSEAEAIKQYKEFRRQLRAGRKQVPLPELSHRFVSTILGRCFHRLPNGQPDMSFWPEKVVEYMIEKQLVGNSNPGAGQAGIALELMEREQWSLIEIALRRLYDIPEMDLVTLLKQVLGLNKAGGAHASENKVPTSEHFLSLVMSAPKNEVFMLQALKKLSVEELASVLEILKRWIQEWDERGGLCHGGQRADKKQLANGVPGYPQIIDFTTVLMDVHFPSLILSPHLHDTIRYIHRSVQTEANISQLMEQSLRGPLGLFERKHRDSLRRKKEIEQGASQGPQGPGVIGGGSRVSADKRRRRKWEGGEGIPDYGVEIIHM